MSKRIVLHSTSMYKVGNVTSPTNYTVNDNSNAYWGKRVISNGTKYYHGYAFMLDTTALADLRARASQFGILAIKVAFKTTERAQTGRSTRFVQWKETASTTTIKGTGEKAYASTTTDAYHFETLDEYNNWVDMPVSNGLPQYGISLLPDTQTGTDTASTRYFFTMDESAGVALYVDINANNYKLSFSANGGTGAPSAQTKEGTSGATFTISSSKPTPASDLWAFDKWNTKADGSGTPYASGGSITITADTTLYAQYVRAKYQVSIAHGNYASGSTVVYKKTKGTPLALVQSQLFSRSGYTITGWSTNADGSTNDYPFGSSYSTEADITLYPYWTALATDDIHIKHNASIYGGEVWKKKNGQMYRGEVWHKTGGQMYKGG